MTKPAAPEQSISVFRLRLGFVLLFFWWFPFWLFIPEIINNLWPDSWLASLNFLWFIISTIQTIIGVIAILIIGKQIKPIVKKTKFRKMPGLIWHVLRKGELPAE